MICYLLSETSTRARYKKIIIHDPTHIGTFNFVQVHTYHSAYPRGVIRIVAVNRRLPLFRASGASDGICQHPIKALLIPMPKPSNSLLLSPPQQPPDSVQSLIQIFERRTEREPDEVVARRVEEVSTVRGVDVEEDSRDYDRSLFQELFEEGLSSISRKERKIKK